MASKANNNTSCSETNSKDSADDDGASTKVKDENYIGLNVGGKIYTTSRTTLTRYPNTFFHGLLDCGIVTPVKDAKGNYVINRNGNIFRHVLNFLRCGELLLSEQKILDELNLLEQEADFFMIEEMKTALVAVKKKIADERQYSKHDCDKLSTLVGLNVGGVVYKTSLFSLRQFSDTFFCRLLDGFVPSAKDDEGNYLIDRDGEIFQHIVNFMRHGELILPEDFDELALLKSEADFYMLVDLKDALEDRVEMVGFVINHQVFKLSRKDVLRNKGSVFYSMINMENRYPRDLQGNYIMEEDIPAAPFVMIFISSGGFLTTRSMTEESRGSLKEVAGFLGLKEVEDHLQSLDFMQDHWQTRPTYIHVYHWAEGPCVAYCNKDPEFLTKRHSNISIYKTFFYSVFRLSLGDDDRECASVGHVDIYALDKDGRPTVDDIVAYFSSRPIGGTPAIVNVVPPKHSSKCTLIEITVNI